MQLNVISSCAFGGYAVVGPALQCSSRIVVVNERCQRALSVRRRGGVAPSSGHLTAIGRAEVTLQAVFSASVCVLHTATIGTVFDCEVALWIGLIACWRFNT
jgi:hypothetical protein